MYVRNRMTPKPFTVTPDTSAADALQLMKDRNIRRVPVVKNDKIVGIITERKLLEVMPKPITALTAFDVRNFMAKTKVEAIMSKDVITVTPGTLLEEAALKMRDYDIGGLPVVDEDKLVGIITETDVFDAFMEIMGFRDHGSRIAVEITEDKPGVLAQVAGIIASNGLNITHLAVYGNELIIRLDTLDLHELLKALREHGFKVISVIKNE